MNARCYRGVLGELLGMLHVAAAVAVLTVARDAVAVSLSASPEHNVVARQVTMWWTTDVSATTEVSYGPSPEATFADYPYSSIFPNLAGTVHSRTLTSLPAGTYYYRVRSTDGLGMSVESSERSFVVVEDESTPLGDIELHRANVYAFARSGSILYFGGSFNEVFVRRGAGLGVDADDGTLLPDQPRVSGEVYAVAPDGAGGFYIGGNIRAVGGLPRRHAAHILPDGGVDPFWNPDLNERVMALAASASTVYLGGYFTTVNGGTVRNYAAAVDAANGSATGWNPGVNRPVLTLAMSASTVYLGGYFTTANGGTVRNYAAAVNASTGALSSWSAGVNNIVSTLAVSGSTVYLGGGFSRARGEVRNHAAAVDATDGSLLAWNPDPNGWVEAVAVSGSTVYLGGHFVTANGLNSRPYAAAVGATDGKLTSWNVSLNRPVFALHVSGSTVFLGGDFTVAGGARNHAAAVDATDGSLTAWNPNLNDRVRAIATAGGTVYLGGAFSSANGGTKRKYAAAVNTATSSLTAWNPDLNGYVRALAVSGSTVYLGGDFTTANDGVVRNRAAAVDATTGALTAWNPDLDKPVHALAVADSTVYLGGDFLKANAGTVRSRAAAVDASTGTLTFWNPNVSGGVRDVAISGSAVYVAGEFLSVGGSTRTGVAAVDRADGVVLPWDARVNGFVQSLDLAGSTVFLGGSFTAVNGTTPRNRAAAVDDKSGLLTSWNPDLDATVKEVRVSGTTVYLGGDFVTANGGIARTGFAPVDAFTGSLKGWDLNLNGGGHVLAVDADCETGSVAIGGWFSSMAGHDRDGLALFRRGPCVVNSPPSAKPQSVAVTEDTPTSVVLAGSDADGQALTFAVATNPQHGSLSGTPPNLTYRPAANYSGPDSFTFTARDGLDRSSAAEVTISVSAVNDAPQLAAIGPKLIKVGEPLAFTVSATDADGDALTLSANPLPEGASFAQDTGSFLWTPAAFDSGTRSVQFSASDGVIAASEVVEITVAPVDSEPPENRPPVLTVPGDRRVTAGDSVEMTISATDPDGDPVTITARALPAGATFDAPTRQVLWTPTEAQVGVHQLEFGATDSALEATAVVRVEVTMPTVDGNSGCGCSGSGGASTAAVPLLGWLLIAASRAANRLRVRTSAPSRVVARH